MTFKVQNPSSVVKEKTYGWLCGKFAIFHMGHIGHIFQAATQVDHLYVIISQDDDRFKDPRLSLLNRTLWLKTIFADMPHITVLSANETGLPTYPDGWEPWSDLIKKTLPQDKKFTHVFTSERADVPNYKKYFQDHTRDVVLNDPDRKMVPISATQIRNDMTGNWSMIPSIVRKDFVLKICIVGTESCGKSILTKMLAKYFQTSWVEEYGRTYCEVDLCMDESLLTFDGYGHIAARRYDMEQEALLSANRVLFSDTAAMSTNFFCLLYKGRENPIVTAYAEREQYDLILHLDDDVEWVDDGLRTNSDRDYTRRLFNTMLQNYAERKNIPVVKISGDYQKRLNTAIDVVREYISRPMTLV